MNFKFGSGFESYSPAEQKRIALGRQVAQEGMVLLENRDDTLPLAKGTRVALFGVGQLGFLHGGSGSGSTFADYVVKLPEAMTNAGAVIDRELLGLYAGYCEQEQKKVEKEPPHMRRGIIEEMVLPSSAVKEASERNSAAVVCISRLAGEGRDRKAEAGDYYLSDTEHALLAEVTGSFSRVIVILNVCGVIDMEWVDIYRPQGVLMAWIPGQEGASAAADILMGNVTPSGRLTDTIARRYSDIPATVNFGAWCDGFELYTGDENQIPYWGGVGNHEAVPVGKTVVRPVGNRRYTEYQEGLYMGYRYFTTFGVAPRYPFGYGLSYTEFSKKAFDFARTPGGVEFKITVTNTGKFPGKEVVQIYLHGAETELERPDRELVAFKKTGLLQPGEAETLDFEISNRSLAAYSEEKQAWVLQKGINHLYVGESSCSCTELAAFDTEAKIVEQLSNQVKLTHTRPLRQLSKKDPAGTWPVAPAIGANSAERHGSDKPDSFIWPEMPTEQGRWLLKDVKAGKVALEEFVKQAEDFELVVLLVGANVNRLDANSTMDKADDKNSGPPAFKKESQLGALSEVVPGMSGYTATIQRLGIPTITMSDGPAGFVGGRKASKLAFPTATITACTFNTGLAEELGEALGAEAEERGIDVWLAPAMNLHRSPLAGRNYEYYSEDPLVSGKIAAAIIRGAQKHPVSACVKHFAANNQETSRWDKDDSIIAQRVLREIYLRGFEIAVKEGDPHSLMTSYNPLNGKQTATHRELLENILRREWGFDGFVVTDWEGDTGLAVESLEAGNDLLMPGFPGMVDYLYKKTLDGSLPRDVLESCACKLLKVVMNSAAFERYCG